MDLSVLFLGTPGSMPTVQRAPASLLVRRGGDRVLIDCGEGTQRQLLRSVGLPGRRARLPDPLPRRSLPRAARDAEDVRAARPRGAADRLRAARACGLMSDLRRVYGKLTYEVQLRRARAERRRRVRRLADRRLRRCHRLEALGYALVEDDRPGRFDPAVAERLGVPAGPEFGRLQRGERVEATGARSRRGT